MRRAGAMLVAAGVVLSAVGCSSAPAGGANSASPAPHATATAERAQFGSTHVYADGSTITATALASYTPHKWSGNVVDGGRGVLTTITITNGTATPLYPFVYPVARSGGVSSEPVGGSVAGLGITPESPIPAGKSIAFEMGFSVQDRDEVTIPLSPNPGYDPVVFTTVSAGEPIPDAPRYTERGVPVDEDIECRAWQSDTVTALSVLFESGSVDPRTGGFGDRDPELGAVTAADVARFKGNVQSTSPRPECEPRWTALDFHVDQARRLADEAATPLPTSGPPAEGGGAGGVDVHVPGGLPDVVDCWKIWRPRCW